MPPDEQDRQDQDLVLQTYIQYPFYGYRKIALELKDKGCPMNRKRVRRIMRRLGITAIYAKPNTSQPVKAHKKYPYLLRGLQITRPNQVWATDITYIRLAGGFAYLAAILDVCSRKVLSWRISNTIDEYFCVEALEEALERFGIPEIFNSDQGGQFTGINFTSRLEERQVRISMDGAGRAKDNIYVERLWRSIKYEDIRLHGYETLQECREVFNAILNFITQSDFISHYNTRLLMKSIIPISRSWELKRQAKRNTP